MRETQHTKLTNSITVARYREMEAAEDRAGCGRLLIERFKERYFEPALHASTRHGFTQMAIACLVVEALECFYQGKADSSRESKRMFKSFFARQTSLQVFAAESNWFFRHIRCGILHQAETTGGWRLTRSGNLLDLEGRRINARSFVTHLREVVANYANQLETDDVLWKNFCVKMDAVCRNCEPAE